MPSAEFKHTITAIERPQTYTGIGLRVHCCCVNSFENTYHLNSWRMTKWSKPQSFYNVCNKCLHFSAVCRSKCSVSDTIFGGTVGALPNYLIIWVYMLTYQIMTDQKQLECMAYFSYLGSLAINYPRCTREIKWGCQFSSTVSRRPQNHIRFRPLEKQLVLKPVEVYIRFRPPLLFMFASPSSVPIPVAALTAAARLLGLWLRILLGEWVCLVKRSPTDCGVSECNHEASTMRSPWPTRAVAP
jgi:hypothetical protein